MITLDDVLADPPLVHYDELNDELRTFGLGEEPMRWLAANVRAEHRTLETGSGMSTIVFAIAGSEHTVVVPNQGEEDRLREYCAGKGIDMGRVRFVIEPAERALPGMDTGPLDVVLIDGSHSFPHVFIDWYYTSHALREGGVAIVDDTQVWTGGTLREFLETEPGWDREQFWSERTALFRKGPDADPDRLWLHQPYVAQRSTPPTRAQRIVQMARSGEWRTLAEKAASNARKAVDRR